MVGDLQGSGGLGGAAGGARSVADKLWRLGHVAAGYLASWRGRLGQHLTRRRAGAADVATLRRQQHELDEDVVVVHEHRDVDEEDVAGGVDERRRRSGTERNDGGERRCGRGCDGVEMSDCRAPRDGWQVQHGHAGSGDYGEG